MATYDITASGGVSVSGCAAVERLIAFRSTFEPGNLVYVKKSAQLRGKLERVTIKEVRIVNSYQTFGQNVVLYVDTLNGLWNETDLVDQAEAVELAITATELMIAQANQPLPCKN